MDGADVAAENAIRSELFFGNEAGLKQQMTEEMEEAVTMAKPTSAFLRAGPSLVPSPVTATTCRVSPTVLSMIPEEQSSPDSGSSFKRVREHKLILFY